MTRHLKAGTLYFLTGDRITIWKYFEMWAFLKKGYVPKRYLCSLQGMMRLKCRIIFANPYPFFSNIIYASNRVIIGKTSFSSVPPNTDVGFILPLNQLNTLYSMPEIRENAPNRDFIGKISFSSFPPTRILALFCLQINSTRYIRSRRSFKLLQIAISLIKSASPIFPPTQMRASFCR